MTLLISVREAAKVVGTSDEQIRKWVNREWHPLPCTQVGRHVKIHGELLEKWLREECSI